MTTATATTAASDVQSRRFVGKVAVVTGGNSGIGLATAKAFAREGARVIITGRDETTLKTAQKDLGREGLAIRADAGQLSDITAMMERIKQEAGKIDVLFVNAGIAQFAPFTEATEASFDATFNINVKGVFFTVQRALRLLSAGASVILNSSISAQMGMAASSIYAASKAAVKSFGRTLATDLLERGIRVNVVSPGPIETPIFGRSGEPVEQQAQMKDWIRNQVPLKRFGRTEEIAEAVLYLASPAAAFVNGTELVVDGGLIGLR